MVGLPEVLFCSLPSIPLRHGICHFGMPRGKILPRHAIGLWKGWTDRGLAIAAPVNGRWGNLILPTRKTPIAMPAVRCKGEALERNEATGANISVRGFQSGRAC